MKKNWKKAVALIMAAGFALSACGGSSSGQADSGTTAAAEAEAGQEEASAETDSSKPSFVFVCTGQLGDKSFNDSANAGIEEIAASLGCETKVIEIGRDQTKWEPTFQDLAEEGKYDVIISNGSSSAEVIEQVAEEFPDQKFVMFDSTMEEDKYPNLYAISYKQNEGSYLAGVLAALVTESDMENANAEKKIGFVGGSEHPIITDFLVGYIAGAKSVDEDIKVYVSYIGSWDDTAKGKETAIAQYNQGVDIIFPAAEQAGLGCVEAAAEMGKYIIGVDSDQAMLFAGVDEAKANVILTSVLKQVGDSLVRMAEMEMEGTVPYGKYEELGIKEGGSGIAINEYYEKNVPQEMRDEVEAKRQEVVDGKIDIPTALGDADQDEIQALINSVAP
ncbi:MAG: BMP family ABC transporter substrate-binding protein [Clostridiales bacterium]|nr:BMP family ABC transporter substrate-binding protein [Clostridiales bacterium]